MTAPIYIKRGKLLRHFFNFRSLSLTIMIFRPAKNVPGWNIIFYGKYNSHIRGQEYVCNT